jgi:hypothetical protein
MTIMYPYGKRKKPRTLPLAVGDLLAVIFFVGIGTYHHGATDPLYAVSVSVPFLIGWVAVAPVAGAYGRHPSARNELFSTLGTWEVAALVGLAIRSSTFFSGNAPLSFGFVMVVGGGFFFVLWRLVVARVVAGLR